MTLIVQILVTFPSQKKGDTSVNNIKILICPKTLFFFTNQKTFSLKISFLKINICVWIFFFCKQWSSDLVYWIHFIAMRFLQTKLKCIDIYSLHLYCCFVVVVLFFVCLCGWFYWGFFWPLDVDDNFMSILTR